MARRYKGANRNRLLKWKYRLGALVCRIAILGVATHYVLNVDQYTLSEELVIKRLLLHFVAVAVFVFLSRFFVIEANILASGLEGEKAVAKMLYALPDSFVTFNDVPLEYEGRRTELDALIVCPYGIFIIEVKNHNGEISGLSSDTHWNQHKVGKGGRTYDSSMSNPLKQLNFQVYLLSKILKKHGINDWITGYVLFTNAAFVSTDSDQVFTSQKAIVDKISTSDSNILTSSQIKRIEKVVKSILY